MRYGSMVVHGLESFPYWNAKLKISPLAYKKFEVFFKNFICLWYIKMCHIYQKHLLGIWWFHRSKDFKATKAGKSALWPKSSPNLNSCWLWRRFFERRTIWGACQISPITVWCKGVSSTLLLSQFASWYLTYQMNPIFF